MILNHIELECAITFMRYSATIVYLNSLKLAELAGKKLRVTFSKKAHQHLYFVQFITAKCKDLELENSLELEN